MIEHDRAICVLDARGYTPDESVRMMRRTFPELESCVVTPAMLERRLRTLDQIVEIDYWRIGLQMGDEQRTVACVGDGGAENELLASRRDKANAVLGLPRSVPDRSGRVMSVIAERPESGMEGKIIGFPCRRKRGKSVKHGRRPSKTESLKEALGSCLL